MPKWLFGLPALACILAIFWLSVIKPPRLYDSGNWFRDNIDKVGHLIAYASLTWTLLWAAIRIMERKLRLLLIITGLSTAAFVYSLLLEFVQYYLPYRSFDPWDLLANATGISLVALIFVQRSKKWQIKKD